MVEELGAVEHDGSEEICWEARAKWRSALQIAQRRAVVPSVSKSHQGSRFQRIALSLALPAEQAALACHDKTVIKEIIRLF